MHNLFVYVVSDHRSPGFTPLSFALNSIITIFRIKYAYVCTYKDDSDCLASCCFIAAREVLLLSIFFLTFPPPPPSLLTSSSFLDLPFLSPKRVMHLKRCQFKEICHFAPLLSLSPSAYHTRSRKKKERLLEKSF